MQHIVELAIEREGEILDAALECPELLELPPAPWATSKGRLNPHTHRFSTRGPSRRKLPSRNATPHYVH